MKVTTATACCSSETVESDARVPPNSLDAEGMVLSFALLHGVEEFPDLQPRHFYADANRHVYEALVELYPCLSAPIDIESVCRYLQDRKLFAVVGGRPYLASLYDTIPASAAPAARSHAAAIVELWKRRVLIAAFQEAEAKLYAGDADSQQAWDYVKEKVRAQRE